MKLFNKNKKDKDVNLVIEKNDFIGKTFNTEIKAVFEDGYWTVTYNISEGRSKDLKKWDEKTMGFKVINRDLYSAINNCNLYSTNYLQKYDYSLFNVAEEEVKNVSEGNENT